MKFTKLIFMLLFISPFLVSCGGDDDDGNDTPQEEVGGAPVPTPTPGPGGGSGGGGGTGGGSGIANFDVILDSGLTDAERISLRNAIDSLERFQIDGSKVAGFSKIFGGNRSSNVVSFLEKRVNYIISEFTGPFSRVVVAEAPQQPETQSPVQPPVQPPEQPAEQPPEQPPVQPPEQPIEQPETPLLSNLFYQPTSSMLHDGVFASNGSVDYWYIDQYYAPEGGARYVISGRPRQINSSRIGVVQLGDIFVSQDPAVQAITLVHEARHSDCPNGALRSDIVNSVESGFTYFPQNLSCGQYHAGPGDTLPWGAYAVDYIYSLAIFNTCSNCTETQKLQALGNANEVQGRAFDINATINGVHGNPALGTSTRIREDL